MRIIAGERRGHKFDGPETSATRPTSDLVREAVFNILGDRVGDRAVYDLFAGTGALGLEALSRGASFSLFIEKDRKNSALIRRNLATLKYDGLGGILTGDAYKWAKAFEPEKDEPVLVFVDPPYKHFEERTEKVRELFEALCERLPEGSTLVVESDRRQDAAILPMLDQWDIRRYGGTQVAILDVPAKSVEVAPDEQGSP